MDPNDESPDLGHHTFLNRLLDIVHGDQLTQIARWQCPNSTYRPPHRHSIMKLESGRELSVSDFNDQNNPCDQRAQNQECQPSLHRPILLATAKPS